MEPSRSRMGLGEGWARGPAALGQRSGSVAGWHHDFGQSNSTRSSFNNTIQVDSQLKPEVSPVRQLTPG